MEEAQTSPSPLLQTKLQALLVRAELVERPRLLRRLSPQPGIRLTLVSAPAGAGKSTLLGQWRATGEQPVAWLSLDARDNRLHRFLRYFIAALAQIDEGLNLEIDELSPSLSPPAVEALLIRILNQAAAALQPFSLVLDDYHLITDNQIHDALLFLIEHLPPSLHLVIATRADPPWPLARLRARGEIVELRSDDLRFSLTEVSQFLDQATPYELSPEDVTALGARTEGWIAGVQMAALALAGLSAKGPLADQGREDASAFIRAFTGSHRFVLDFLIEEVLQQQPDPVQEFLFQTSILEQLSAPLCDAVTQRQDSQGVLISLERANMFLIPLDGQRRWYRYHHLFADLLRSRLEQTQGELLPVLHRRASAWYEQNQLIADAVSHSLAANNREHVLQLVESQALMLIYQGKPGRLVEWLAGIPEEVQCARPWLCIAQAWANVYAGQLDAVEPALRLAQTEGAGEEARIKGHSAAIRAYAAFLDWDLQAIELAREALEYLPADDLSVRGLAAMVLAIGYYGSGDLVAAERAFAEAIAASQAANNYYIATNALCELADLQMTKGQLRQAAGTCHEALRMAGVPNGKPPLQSPLAGYALGRLSVVLVEQNELASALSHAQKSVELSTCWGQADTLILSHCFLASASLACGDVDRASEAIGRAKQLAGDVSPRYRKFVSMREARIFLAAGDVPAAIRWMEESGLSVADERCRPIRSYIFLARVLLAREQFGECLGLLARLSSMARAGGAMGYVIELTILEAVALWGAGEQTQAVDRLAQALTLAEPEGYVRSFIDQGAVMEQLLHAVISRGIQGEYAARLLEALERDMARKRQPASTAQAGLLEPLSERELEVLRFLLTHLTSTEMADALTISPNTVRTHIKNIYGKLGVHSRQDAVRRARELMLL